MSESPAKSTFFRAGTGEQANIDSERCVVGAYCNTPLQIEIIRRSPVPASCNLRVSTFCRRLMSDLS